MRLMAVVARDHYLSLIEVTREQLHDRLAKDCRICHNKRSRACRMLQGIILRDEVLLLLADIDP